MSSVPSHKVLQQAAAWYSSLCSGRVSEQDLGKWREWLGQHSEHRQAWELVEQVRGHFSPFHEEATKQGALQALGADAAPRLDRRRALLSLGGLSLATWLGWRTFSDPASGLYLADYSTRIGESRQWQLPGGGHLWLNTGSAADRDARGARVELRRGELQVDTRQVDNDRLIVGVPHAEMRPRRALFNLRLLAHGACLDVFAGTLDVTCLGQRQQVLPGEQLILSRHGFSPLGAADRAHRAWVQGLLVAEGLALGQVVAELGRYRQGHLSCDPRVTALSVVGTFSLRDTDRALASLARVLPIKVSAPMPWWVVVEAAT